MRRAAAAQNATDQSSKPSQFTNGDFNDRYEGGAASDMEDFIASDFEPASEGKSQLDQRETPDRDYTRKKAHRKSRSRSRTRNQSSDLGTHKSNDTSVKRKRGRPRKSDAQKAADKAKREQEKKLAREAEIANKEKADQDSDRLGDQAKHSEMKPVSPEKSIKAPTQVQDPAVLANNGQMDVSEIQDPPQVERYSPYQYRALNALHNRSALLIIMLEAL